MRLRSLVRAAIMRSPPALGLLAEREQLTAELQRQVAERDWFAVELAKERRFVPGGHFYSPIPAPDEVERDAGRLFADTPATLPGIDLREPAQLALLNTIGAFGAEAPWSVRPGSGLRYGFDNTAFSLGDAVVLYGMLRHYRPRRLIEIGSGYSSCVTLDTNERFLDGAVETTFIEPYPELLRSLLSDADRTRVEIVPTRVQDVPLERYDALAASDILFIDSTHVGKIGSDVNHLLHTVLPRLAPGVVIHVHDIMFPFEYPRPWIDEGRAWNEAYLLQCFLQFNDAFEILLWSDFLIKRHADAVRRALPSVIDHPGSSLWLRRR